MYNILIVDDEKIIREGIGDSFSETGEFHVSFASNGIEALDMCAKQTFDAILIDVVMPRMNGLKLLSKLAEQKNEAIKIVLSAYDEFEYVREAMLCNATDYLLKPFYPQDIKQLADKLISAIERRKKAQKEYLDLIKTVEESKDIIREKLLEDLLSDRVEEEDFSKRQFFLGEAYNGGFCVMMLKTQFAQNACKDIEPKEYQARLMSISNEIEKTAAGYAESVLLKRNSDTFIFLFNGLRDSTEIIERLFDDVKANLEDFSVSVCGGIGGMVDDIRKIKFSYREAITALKYNVSFYRENVLNFSDIQKGSEKISRFFDEETFSANLRLGDSAWLIGYFDSILSALRQNQEYYSYNGIELMLIKILVLAMTVLLEVDAEGYESINNKNYNVIAELRDIQFLDDKIIKVKNIIIEIADIIENTRDNQNSKIIEKVKKFIISRYNEDISLADLANAFYLSKNYLGQLFKQKTDMNVIEYIHRTRIAKAKEMIENTDMKIYEIANMVGYQDQHYFSSVFKRFVGVSPTDFREIH